MAKSKNMEFFKIALYLLILSLSSSQAALFEPFDMGLGEYFASGYQLSPRVPGGKVPNSIAISQSREALVWNLTSSIYYVYHNVSYVIFYSSIGDINSSVCLYRDDYNFSVMRAEYASSLLWFQTSQDNRVRKIYGGNVKDVGSCCEKIGMTIQTLPGNRISKLIFSQYFPAISTVTNSTNPDDAQVSAAIVYTNYRLARNRDFKKPLQCINPIHYIDYCEFWYRRFGFCIPEDNVGIPLEITRVTL